MPGGGFLTAANEVILRTIAHNSINMYTIHSAYNAIAYSQTANFDLKSYAPQIIRISHEYNLTRINMTESV